MRRDMFKHSAKRKSKSTFKNLIKNVFYFTAATLIVGAADNYTNNNRITRTADSPAELSKGGWKDAFIRTKEALKDKDLATSAAAVAYYTTLTFFPALLGLATVYATFAGPQQLAPAIAALQGIMPDAIHDIIKTQLGPLTEANAGTVGIAALISIAALLWTTSGGLQNLVKATNYAYEEEETRNIIALRLLNIVLSAILIVLGGLILFILLLQPDALQKWGWPSLLADSFTVLRWPAVIILLSIVLSVIYRYAPNRRNPRWQWVSWGATAATIIWVIASVLFFLYVQNFGNFNRSYGTFAGIIILMIWFNISSLIVLLGAQVNKKLEEVAA